MKFIYSSELIQDNLEEMWSSISLSSFIEGKEWYWVAHNIAQDMVDEYSIPLEIAVGIISATSVQKSWEENLKIANAYLKTEGKGHIKHTSIMVSKCHNIYMYSSLYRDKKKYIESVLNGKKIVSFFNNILNPYDRTYCTIDTHQISICTGLTKLNRITDKQYDFLHNEMNIFAKKQKLLPLECQAILWTYYRKNK